MLNDGGGIKPHEWKIFDFLSIVPWICRDCLSAFAASGGIIWPEESE